MSLVRENRKIIYNLEVFVLREAGRGARAIKLHHAMTIHMTLQGRARGQMNDELGQIPS